MLVSLVKLQTHSGVMTHDVEFVSFSLFFFLRLTFEQDIERGNTDGLGDCHSK